MSPSWDPVQIEREAYERADEPMGTKEKFWVRLPDDDRLRLFKLARESDGIVRGEDWAEWVVHQLATLIGIPSAEIRPALWNEHLGIVSRSMLRGLADELVHRNSVLVGHDPTYDQRAQRENPGYTAAAVRDALAGVLSPASTPELVAFSGYDVWAGYLLLDAWTAGRDRHHENWGLLRVGAERRLAPSFDHGNALGFAETDEARQKLLDNERKFARWLARGKSHHFAGRPSLVDLAIEALRLATPEAAEYWIEHLNTVDEQAVEDVVEAVPKTVLSAMTSRFIVRLLGANRRRVLNGYRASQSG